MISRRLTTAGLTTAGLTTAGLAAVAALLAGCTGTDDDGRAEPAPSATTSASPIPTQAEPRVAGVIAENLRVPWGLVLLPDGSALVAERDTALVKRIGLDGEVESLGRVPGVRPGGEGGLHGLAIPPDYERSRWVYAYFTSATDNRIVRMRYRNGRLGASAPILAGIPKGLVHNGGRIAFGPDGMLYATTGETGRSWLAQDLGSLGGKILRMTPDGDPAPDNPYGDSVVWTYGHRNPQGIAWDDQGRMWASEFGQNTWDELNLIEPGNNYGWPRVEGITDNRGYVNPVAEWEPQEASPSGIAVADGAIWMAALRGARLWRIPLTDAGVGEPTEYFVREYGRLRTVVAAPDGSLWLTTSNHDGRAAFPREGDDKILRVVIE